MRSSHPLLQPLADRILEIPFRYHLAAAEKLASMGVDMIWTGDDIGSQKGMLFHPDTWRRFLKPRMAELVSRVKAINPDLKVAYHTDGDVREDLRGHGRVEAHVADDEDVVGEDARGVVVRQHDDAGLRRLGHLLHARPSGEIFGQMPPTPG